MKDNIWNVKYDPEGILENGISETGCYESEDIFQAHCAEHNLVLDLGNYGELYKVYLVKDSNWDTPIEIFESDRIDECIAKVLDVIANERTCLS